MFLIIIEITSFILLPALILGFCATRSQNEYIKKDEISEKRSPQLSSPSRSKRARPLEPEDLIPPAEGSEKNPDVGAMIDERSKKSQKRMERSKKMKGYVMEKDRSVRRLEDGSKYEAKTSAKYRRMTNIDVNGSQKSAKSPKQSRKSKKEKIKEKKSEKSKSSKKEKKSEKEKVNLETKKSEKKLQVEELESKKDAGEVVESNPAKLKKVRKPWKNLFKLKRRRPRKDVHVAERNGTWA